MKGLKADGLWGWPCGLACCGGGRPKGLKRVACWGCNCGGMPNCWGLPGWPWNWGLGWLDNCGGAPWAKAVKGLGADCWIGLGADWMTGLGCDTICCCWMGWNPNCTVGGPAGLGLLAVTGAGLAGLGAGLEGTGLGLTGLGLAGMGVGLETTTGLGLACLGDSGTGLGLAATGLGLAGCGATGVGLAWAWKVGLKTVKGAGLGAPLGCWTAPPKLTKGVKAGLGGWAAAGCWAG